MTRQVPARADGPGHRRRPSACEGRAAGAQPLRHRRRHHRGAGARRRVQELPGLGRRPRARCHRGVPGVRQDARALPALRRRRPPGLDGRDGPLLPHPVRRRRPDHGAGSPSRCSTSSRRRSSCAATGRASPRVAGPRAEHRASTCAATPGRSGRWPPSAVGHDPGEPNNVEDVRIQVYDDLEHAVLTYRGRGLELEIPTLATPSWYA